MSKLESLEFSKGVTEGEIRLRPENPYFNPVKLKAYDVEGNEINSEEVKVSSIQFIKHFKENQVTSPYLTLEKKDNELLIQSTTDQDWKNVEFVKVKLAIEDDFEYDPFNKYGGLGKFYQLFKEDYKKVLEELNEVLVA